jgi:hypothetical protein
MSKRQPIKLSNEDPNQYEMMKEYVWSNVRKQYISHIPMESIKELPGFYKVYLGGTAYLLMFGVFVYFTYTSYLSSVTQPFMSLTSGSGCNPVTVNVSGTFQADSNGNWYGQVGFDYTKAIYSMQFSFVDGGKTQFQAALAQFKQETIRIGNIAVNQSLPRNLLYWMAYITTAYGGSSGAESSISFEFTGQANVIFDTDYVHGQVGYEGGMCDVDSLTTFDQSNGLLKLTYNYSQYTANPTCTAAANPYALGYFPTINQEDFTLTVDVNTFSVASAINYQIINISSLQQVPGQSITQNVEGYFNVTFGEFFDPRTPLMETVICVTNFESVSSARESFPYSLYVLYERIRNRPTCFMRFGGMPSLPVFRHYGAEKNTPLACLCATGVGKTSTCQEFDMILSFVFYNYPGNKTATSLEAIRVEESTVLVQLLILLNQTDNYELFNEAAYNASWAPISYIYPESAALTNSKKWRKSSFEFCALNSLGLGNTYCSIISLNPISTTSKSVSEYFYQVKSGSCSDTFTVNASTWTTLASNPPAQFLQPYYECVMDTTNALINAAGIAQGNVATVLPFLVIAALPIMYMTLHLIGQVFVVCSFAV